MMSLQERLTNKKTVIMDGGVSTEMERKGLAMDGDVWSGTAHLSHPDLVREVHEDYIRAGAEVITANTFAAAAHVLARVGKGDDAAKIMARWNDFMATAPEDVSSNFMFWSIPPVPGFPEALHGTPVVITAAVHSGALEDGEKLLQPLRELGEPILDLSGPVPYNGVQTAFDPLFVKGERLNYWKSLYLDRIDDAAIDRIVARANDRPNPWSLIAFWHLGGAMNRVDPAETALGVRDAAYLYSLDTSWTDHADDARAIGWTRDAWAEMQDYSSGAVYLNFPGQGEEGEKLMRASYGDANYERLVALKTKYDPTNLFRMNQNIKPNGG